MSLAQTHNEEYTKKVVLRFSHIGDIILLSSVLYWRYTEYNEKFILLTAKGMECLFDNNPAIEHIETFTKEELRGRNLRVQAKKMAEKFPYPLYDMHATFRSRIFKSAWKQATYTYPKDAIARRLFLFSRHKIRKACLDLHVVERYAYNFLDKSQYNQIDRKRLLPKLFMSAEEESYAKSFFQERNKENKPIIALHPFATHKGKMWDIGHWEKLYKRLLEENYFPLLIGIGKAFSTLKQEHNALNVLTLRQSAALLSRAKCLVTGDSAPLHLASSVQTPVVALFGSTSKDWGFFPLGEKDKLLQYKMPCNPCTLHGKKQKCKFDYSCINKITVEEVMEAIYLL